MFWSLCKEHLFKNTMAMGTNNFKTTTIDRHIVSNDHKTALPFPKAKQDLNIAIANAKTRDEISIMLYCVAFCFKEFIALNCIV